MIRQGRRTERSREIPSRMPVRSRKGVPRSIEKAKELYADSAEWGNDDTGRSILRLDPDWREEDPDDDRILREG